MAVSLLQYPSQLEPVYSPIWFVTNTLTKRPNYRFVYDLYTIDSTGDETKINRSKLWRNPDGYGVYSPARVLENYVSFDFDFWGEFWKETTHSTLNYRVNFGEEYDLTGATFAFSSITNNGGYVQYNYNISPGFNVDDQIKIDKSNKGYNSTYDGLQFVISKSGSTGIVTDKLYGDYYANESGQTLHRLSFTTGITFTGTVINFGRQYLEKDVDITAKYNLTLTGGSPFTNTIYNATPSTSLLTFGLLLWNIPNFKPIKLQVEDSYFLTYLAKDKPYAAWIVTYNAQNESDSTYEILYSGLTAGVDRFTFACGPKNLSGLVAYNVISGNYEQIIDDTVDHYDVYMVDNTTQQLGETRSFKIINGDCRYTKYRLAFLNKVGGVDIINFTKKSTKKVEIERQTYTKYLNYNYRIGDRGETMLSAIGNELITANTDWIEEYEVDLLRELYESPEVYLIDDSNQQYLPVVITTKDYKGKTRISDKLIQYQIEFKMAYNTVNQRN